MIDGWTPEELEKARKSQPELVAGIERRDAEIASLKARAEHLRRSHLSVTSAGTACYRCGKFSAPRTAEKHKPGCVAAPEAP